MKALADLDLCQAHQMCQTEAPDVFGFDEDADRVTLLQEYADDNTLMVIQLQQPCRVRYRRRAS